MQGSLFYVSLGALLLGVVAGLLFSAEVYTAIAAVLIVSVTALTAYVLHTSKAAWAIFLCGMLFVVGVLRAGGMVPVHDPRLDAWVDESVVVTGVVRAEPDERETSTRVTLEVARVARSDEVVHSPVRIVAILPSHSLVAYGDTLVIRGVLHHPEPFETDTGRTFAYPEYLAVSGVGYTLSFATVEKRIEGGWSIIGTLFAIKQAYVSGLGQAIPEPAAALAGGITVGDKRALGGTLTDIFRDVGLIHIVVLSGYNITVIIAFLLAALGRFDMRVKIVVGVLFILGFVAMTGASATGMRAGIMAALGLVALVVHRRYAVTRALMIAVVVMVLANPRMLLYDPGFQLSVVATLGLVHVAPMVERFFWFVPSRFHMREIAAATLGTQIAVLPLIAYLMGTVSLIALPVNLVTLPFVPVAMLLSFVAGVVGGIAPGMAMIIGFPAYVILAAIIFIAEAAAVVPVASVIVPEVPLALVGIVYAVLSVIVLRQSDHSPRSS